MIRHATLTDLKAVKKITEACAVALNEHEIFQWNKNYPSLNQLRDDIKNHALYVYEVSEKIIGIVMITPETDEVYNPVNWASPSGNNLYVHRLAVHPKFWGKGYARALMDFAEKFARENGFDSVRLDTFSKNKRNHSFYEIRGYQRLGEIYYPQKSEHPFYCYELPIS